MTIHSSILAREILQTEGAWQATAHGVVRVGHDLVSKPPPPPLEHKWPLLFKHINVMKEKTRLRNCSS